MASLKPHSLKVLFVDNYTYSELLKSLQNKCDNIALIIKPEKIKQELERIEKEQEDPNFWQDVLKARDTNKEKVRLNRLLETYQKRKFFRWKHRIVWTRSKR